MGQLKHHSLIKDFLEAKTKVGKTDVSRKPQSNWLNFSHRINLKLYANHIILSAGLERSCILLI